MKKLHGMMVAGLGVVMLCTSSAMAAPPAKPNPPGGADDQARANRQAAAKLLDEAAALDKEARRDRQQAWQTYLAAVRASEAKETQADLKRQEAQRLRRLAGKFTIQEFRAQALRLKGMNLQRIATEATLAAQNFDTQAAAELARAKAQHDAANALLASNPNDPAIQKEAAELHKAAEQDERDAKEFQNQATAARNRATRATNDAVAALTLADQLDPDGSFDYGLPGVPRVNRRT